MRYKLFCASCMMAVAVIGAAPAYADTDHGFECGDAGASSYPGNSATSPGSVFNEPTANSPGGKGNQAYNDNARNNKNFPDTPEPQGAPSQYDTACGRVTANGTGTPYQPMPTATTNNSRATRDDILQVTSHIGKGQTK